MSEFILIAACSQNKKPSSEASLRMRYIRGVTIDTRAKKWAKLVGASTDGMDASEIYQGQYWSCVRDCLNVLRDKGMPCRLLIVSAGFGLLAKGDLVPNYSATFQADSPDTIFDSESDAAGRLNGIDRWWKLINEHFVARKQFSTIQAALHKETSVIMSVLPPSYFGAVRGELETLLEQRPGIEQVVLGTQRHAAFRDWDGLIPLETDLQHKLGGGRVSLAPRMLNDYLSSKRDLRQVSVVDCRNFFRRRIKQFGKAVKYDRQPLADETVRKIIRQHLATGMMSYTPSLRALRSAGFACEMKRFRGIFEEEKRSA